MVFMLEDMQSADPSGIELATQLMWSILGPREGEGPKVLPVPDVVT